MVFRDRTYRLLVVSASVKFNTVMREMLPHGLYYPVEFASSASEARTLFSPEKTDIVLVNSPLPDAFGDRLAKEITASSGACVLFLISSGAAETFSESLADEGILCLPKPATVQNVLTTLRMAASMRERIRRIEHRELRAEESLRTVNRAKWLLIGQRGMTEAEAQKYLTQEAMQARKTIPEAAAEIISKYS